MPELIADLDYSMFDEDGREYFVNVVAELVAGGSWEAWLEFVPTDNSEALLTSTETHQASRRDVEHWASVLDAVYIEGAFRRAMPADSIAGRDPITPVSAAVALGTAAALDPFAIYSSLGKEALRARLRPLTRAELLTIIAMYNLDPARLSLARLTNSQLVTFIATATEAQVRQGRR